LLDGRTIIAHNVGFDAAVLKATSEAYDIALPQIDLQCTRLIAKRTWPGQSGYGLAAIAERLAIRFQHHNALEDARASAKIAFAAAEKARAADLDALEESLGLIRGRIWVDQIRQPRTVRRSRIESVAEPMSRYQPKLFRADGTPSASRTEQIRKTRLRADAILAGCEDSCPLAGKHVVLINSLLGMQREDAISFLTHLGATVQSKINLQTHYVIMGTESELDRPGASASETNHSLSSEVTPDAIGGCGNQEPLAEIEKRKQDGQPVRILSQRQLLACIPSALAIARGDM
jgi:DNA polymerase-3 subunit epsilon